MTRGNPEDMAAPRQPRPEADADEEMELSVILPAFNEEGNVGRTLAEVLAYLSSRFTAAEVLVVDDGSGDGTAATVEEWSRRDGRVRLLRHPRNRGYGAALRTGFAAARGRLVFFTDADGQFDMADLDRLLANLDGCDGVLGHRVRRRDNAVRCVSAWAWNLLVRLLLGVPYRDVDCAFKLYRREALAGLVLASDGAAVNAEMLARLHARGCRLRQVGVSHRPRLAGSASGLRPRVVARALAELVFLAVSLHRPATAGFRGSLSAQPGRQPTRG